MQEPQILASKSDLVPTGSEPDFPEDSGAGLNPESVTWQAAMRRAIRSPRKLLEVLGLTPESVGLNADDRCFRFPTFVPHEFLARIKPGDPADPLLRQVLPSDAELDSTNGFVADPVGDLNAMVAPGVLQKYEGRALLVSTGACGIHCRYCFRQEFPYSESGGQADQLKAAIGHLQRDETIEEVLLSGGDPLTLVDEKLFGLVDQISKIRHIRRLRIHSRMPIVIPQRVSADFAKRLAETRFATWFVVHCNHSSELSDSVLSSISHLIDAGIPVLNQAVLLRGVNDDVEVLRELCLTLVNHRVQPYYLHQMDRVQGAAHFEVPVQEGLQLVEQLRQRLPGYAVPTYVQERCGEPSKSLLT